MTDGRPVAAAESESESAAVRERRPRRIDAGLNGILVVDKPVGPTSHDVVALVRRLAGTKRIGHGGTLDPFASGVLPLYLGVGTRVVEFHLGARKAYRATVCFGASSTTDDLEGELTQSNPVANSYGGKSRGRIIFCNFRSRSIHRICSCSCRFRFIEVFEIFLWFL